MPHEPYEYHFRRAEYAPEPIAEIRARMHRMHAAKEAEKKAAKEAKRLHEEAKYKEHLAAYKRYLELYEAAKAELLEREAKAAARKAA